MYDSSMIKCAGSVRCGLVVALVGIMCAAPIATRAGSEAGQAKQGKINQHDVLPILLLRCATCHGRQRQKNELDLRTREAMLRGGKSGPALVPGNPEESLIIRKIKAREMPPRADLAKYSVKPVAPYELEKLVEWISAGAPVVDVAPQGATTDPDPLVTDADREFWSFQPLTVPEIPVVRGLTIDNPIDAFIARKLHEAGLRISPEANRHTLIRRAYFDLIGLPPQPHQVAAFIADDGPLAYERLIDELLASPQYGERWGQYWLDLAGYCDSEGGQNSDPMRPYAWKFRDYVIRAFSDDKPYDQFLFEQIAGDELADYENANVITSEIYDNLVATGFLRMGSDATFSGITGFVPDRLDVIDDQIRILSSSVMGLTVSCARCHSHKFDPIPQRDYYQLAALLKPAMDEHDWLKPVTGGAATTNEVGNYRYLSYVTVDERRKWEKQEQLLKDEIIRMETELETHEGDDEFTKAIEQKIKGLKSKREPEPKIRALWDRGDPSPTYILNRGNYLQPTRLVSPGVPSVLTDGRTPFVSKPPWPSSGKTGNRLALARWLTRPGSAAGGLTARVMVNRMWKHHFGAGIVKTLDDFGKMGTRPTHPELLDFLAMEFSSQGWSIKQMHRLIMTSATYRQSSKLTPQHERFDLENRLFSRMAMRRMEAEVLRDSLLSVAGRLDPTPFGKADAVKVGKDGSVSSVGTARGWRRSIYVLKRRSQRLTILNNFDRPRMSPNCIQRTESTVVPQALHLMNNKMVHDLSRAFAERVIREAGSDHQEQILRAFLIALGRSPSELEKSIATQQLARLTRLWAKRRESESSNHDPTQTQEQTSRRALGNLCHAVMNSAAFLYID